MWVHRVSETLKPLMPERAFSVIRQAGTAILTPAVFAFTTGHFRSSLAGKAMDRRGDPIPWYSYPMIDFLEQNDFCSRRILEWGAGQSTLWWSARAKNVVAFEDDKLWYHHIKTKLARDNDNVELHLVASSTQGCKELLEGVFDVIIIDGLERKVAAEQSLTWLSTDGAVLVDNSEGFWGEPGTYPIMNMFRQAGFQRVDFYGFYPAWIQPSVTSLFFRDRCFLFEGKDNPVRRLP